MAVVVREVVGAVVAEVVEGVPELVVEPDVVVREVVEPDEVVDEAFKHEVSAVGRGQLQKRVCLMRSHTYCQR